MSVDTGPIRAVAPASVLFCQHILQHGLVGAQIGNQLIQPEILFLRLSHVLQLRGGNPAVFLAPRTECGIGAPQLATDLRYRCTQFSLPEGKDNLFFSES